MSNIFPNALYSGNAFPLALDFWAVQPDPDALPPVVGVPEDLTGQYVGVTVKNNRNDADADAVFKRDLPGDSTGQVTFQLTIAAAGNYWLDSVRWASLTGTRTLVLAPFEFTINQSVTQRLVPSP